MASLPLPPPPLPLTLPLPPPFSHTIDLTHSPSLAHVPSFVSVTMMFLALGMSILTFFVKRLPSRGAGPFKAFGSFLVCVILHFLSRVLGTDVYARPVTAGIFWTLVWGL